ncbi:MAG: cyclase family protein [Rubrobacteraceae bacterium]
MRVGRIVDLSHRVDENTQIFPGDPEPSSEPAVTIEDYGMNVLSLHLGSHSGTHVDAPYHFVGDGKRIDDMDPKLFVGPAMLMDVRGKEPRGRITVEDLQPYETLLCREVIAVMWTGWDEHYGTPRYYDHPFLDHRAAQLLLDSGVKTIAIDALSVDETVLEGPHPEGYPAHKLLCGAGCVIAENLTGLGDLDFPNPVLSLLPVKLGDADGAPVRAVAMEVLG